MNPQASSSSAPSSPSGTPPNPHFLQPTQEEILELGFLAVEDTPDSVVHPLAQPAAPVAPPPPAIIRPQSATPPAQQPQPSNQPAPPKPSLSLPPKSLDLSKPNPTTSASPMASATIAVDRMDFSANSMHMRSIGRLRIVNNLLYLVIFGLAVVVVLGGWILYKYLSRGGSLF